MKAPNAAQKLRGVKYLLFLLLTWLPLAAIQAADSDLLKGQVLYIPCNGNTDDQSGMNHPVENSGAIFVSDRLGHPQRSCFFSGQSYLKIPKNSDFNMSPNLTIAAYVLVEGSYNNESRAIISNDSKQATGDGAQYFGIGMMTGNAVVFFDNSAGLGGAIDVGSTSITPTPLANGQWHHVAAVFEGGVNTRLYVDGVQKRRSEGTMPASITPTGDLFIGRDGRTEKLGKRWVGSLDEVRIFNRALSDNEISLLSAVIDLPTGETFIPLGTGDNDPYLLTVKDSPIGTLMVTPHTNGDIALNRVPSSTPKVGTRAGERALPPETSTLILNQDGSVTLLDETQPGVVATFNILGDLEVTATSIPDLKLLLRNNSKKYEFIGIPDDPSVESSVKVTVEKDGSLSITDDTRPNLFITRNLDRSYTVVDRDANTTALVDRYGDGVLYHPEARGIVAIFNIFKEGYTLLDTETGECIELNADGSVRSGLRSSTRAISIAGSAGATTSNTGSTSFLSTLKTSVKTGIADGVKSATSSLTSKAITSVVTKVAGAAAPLLAGFATKAAMTFTCWAASLPAWAPFAVAGVVAIAAAGIFAALYIKKLKKEIEQLRTRVQELEATVQLQAARIQALEKTVTEQAEKIQSLEQIVAQQAADIQAMKLKIADQAALIDQQAQEIASLKITSAQQAEKIAKQDQMIAAMNVKIADLEAKVAAATQAIDQIPPGIDPAPVPTVKSSHSRSTLRTANACPTLTPKQWQFIKVLPDKLGAFAASVMATSVNLTWTAGDFFDQFILWRGKPINGQCNNDVSNYTDIAKIGIVASTSGTESHYAYQDTSAEAGNTYCYAIEATEPSGTSTVFWDSIVPAMVP